VVTLLLVLLLVLVVGLAVAVTVGRIGGGLPQPATDVPPPLEGPVREPADLDRARFQLAFRGYRMDQVDQVLDAARDALAARDREIARLRGAVADDSGGATDRAGDPVTAAAADGDPFRRPAGTDDDASTGTAGDLPAIGASPPSGRGPGSDGVPGAAAGAARGDRP
jgi:DivIVA domain-containing protein